jgi:hypothetical protein
VTAASGLRKTKADGSKQRDPSATHKPRGTAFQQGTGLAFESAMQRRLLEQIRYHWKSGRARSCIYFRPA